MSKKWGIILAVLAGVVVLALGGGAVALAAGEQTTPTSNPLFARVAGILGITEQQLTDAFQQAQTQVENEAIDQWLTKALDNQTITQDEASKIKDWLAQRPSPPAKDTLKAWLDKKPQLANPGALRGLLQAPGRIRQFGYCPGWKGVAAGPVLTKVAAILNIPEQKLQDAFQQASQELRAQKFDNALANAVKNGKITQDEADQIKAWCGQRPAALDKLAPGKGLVGPGCGRFGRGGMMRGIAPFGAR